MIRLGIVDLVPTAWGNYIGVKRTFMDGTSEQSPSPEIGWQN